jgi:hypothetical protein
MDYYITSINDNGKGISKKQKVRKRPKKCEMKIRGNLPLTVSTVLPYIIIES